MHLSVASPPVELKDLLGQHIFKELCTRCRKITVHVLYILYNYISGKDNKILHKKLKPFLN